MGIIFSIINKSRASSFLHMHNCVAHGLYGFKIFFAQNITARLLSLVLLQLAVSLVSIPLASSGVAEVRT